MQWFLYFFIPFSSWSRLCAILDIEVGVYCLYTRIPWNLSERGPWVWFFCFNAIPEVSDSQISANCLQDWLSSSFLCRFWHNIVLFIQSLGFSLRESCRKFGQRSRWGGPTPIAKSFFYLVRLLEVESDAFSCSWSVCPWSGYWNRSFIAWSRL